MKKLSLARHREWLSKRANAAPPPVGGPSHDEQRYQKHVQDRFGRLQQELKLHGDEVGTGHKRILFDKKHLGEDDLKHLGFVPVSIAIPEAGQTRFQSFRHPGNNFHIHEHGDSWTMHEDRHAASTMLVKKWKMEQAARKEGKPLPTVPSSVAKSKTKKRLTPSRNSALTPAIDFIKGAPHAVTEGIPGAYYYARGRLTGAEGMSTRVKRALPAAYNKRLRSWKELKKPGTPAPVKQANMVTSFIGKGLDTVATGVKAIPKALGVGTIAPGSELVAAKKALHTAAGGARPGAHQVGGVVPRISMPAQTPGKLHTQSVKNSKKLVADAERKAQAATVERNAARAQVGAGLKTVGKGALTTAAIGAEGLSLKNKVFNPPSQLKVGSLKEAADAALARRQRHEYYMRNRQEMLIRNRQYRAQNSEQLKRKKRRYHREVKAGVRKQRKRIDQGGHSYGFMGFR